MPQHEPETVSTKRQKLCTDLSDVLQGVDRAEAALMLGYIFGRVLLTAKPEVRKLLGEVFETGMTSAAA